MGRNKLIIAALLGMSCIMETQAQIPYVLGIDSIAALPDSVIDGQEYTFYVEMTNGSPLVFQGDSNSVSLMFEYNGTDTVQADQTILQSQFIGPVGNSTLLEVSHRFSSGGGSSLGIGINVVVVWPRINDGMDPLQEVAEPPYVRNIVLLEPNSIRRPRSGKPFRAYPNPSSGLFELSAENSDQIISVELLDLSGRLQQAWNGHGTYHYKVQPQLKGNFILKVTFEDGSRGHQIMVLR